jgi:hypothetical protein
MAALVLVSLCAVGASTLSVSAAQGSSSYVRAPTVVGAPVGSGAPGVCTIDGTGLFLFIRGSDNVLYMKHSSDGVTWQSTSTNLGGQLASPPAATATSNGVIEVFAEGTDGHLYEKISPDSGATWSSTWIYLGGQLLENKGPSVCSWVSAGTVYTEWFVTGTDNHCYYATQIGGGTPSNWNYLGGTLTSAPGATALSDGSQIGLFVAGTGGSLWYKHYTTTTGWDNSWASLSGQVLAGTSPAAYNFGPSQIGWLVTGTDSNLYRNWVGNSAGYEGINGVLTSSPSATAITPGGTGHGISVFARGSTGPFAALYQIDYNYSGSGGWGVWNAIGGV